MRGRYAEVFRSTNASSTLTESGIFFTMFSNPKKLLTTISEKSKAYFISSDKTTDRCSQMSAKQAHIGTRTDRDVKEACEKVFRRLGLTTAEAIRIFLSQVKIQGRLPFVSEIQPQSDDNDDLLLPNEMRQAAIDTVYED